MTDCTCPYREAVLKGSWECSKVECPHRRTLTADYVPQTRWVEAPAYEEEEKYADRE